MKRSGLKRRTTLEHKPLRKKVMRRDWRAAILKKHREGCCRVCKSEWALSSSHVMGRRYDESSDKGVLVVHEDSTVPLCSAHHQSYDAHELDLLPYLSIAEQCRGVYEAGGVMSFLRRVSGREAVA